MPTATASDSPRQRWTRARLSGPEIHFESPPLVAVNPSRLIADFSTTSGRPVIACLRKAWTTRRAAAASAPSAKTTSTPSSRRIPGPRPEAFSRRVVAADHDPRDAGGEQRVGARRLATLVRAGLEGDVDGRPGRVVAALAAIGERRDLGVNGTELRVPALADHRVAADHDGADRRVRADPAHASLSASSQARRR